MREENNLDSELKSIFSDIEEIKTTQPLAGDGWIFYRITTGVYPDLYFPGTTVGTYRYKITFTPTPGSDPDKLSAARFRYIWEAPPLTSMDQIRAMRVSGEDNAWYFVCVNPGGGPHYITFMVLSTQDGTLTKQAV